MRMTKKFAVTVVAAVIAAAMLTACGGDAPATPGNPDGGSSSSSSASDSANSGAASSGSTAEKPGSESSASSSENAASSTPAEPDKDDHQPEKNPLPANPQSWADSWTKAMYAKRGATDKDLFAISKTIVHAKNSTVDQQCIIKYVTSGAKSYAELTALDETGKKEQCYADETGYYDFDGEQKKYVKVDEDTAETREIQLQIMQSVYRVPTTSNVASCTGAEVNGKWIETITLKDGSSYVYTYSKEDGSLQSLVSKFNKLGEYTCTSNAIDITSYTQARYVFSFPTVDTQQ